jgi:hypothetical protein
MGNLRRRFPWTAVSLVLALALTGCFDDEPSNQDGRSAPPVTAEPDDQTLLLELYAGARQTLAEFLDPANRPLTCPGEYADTAIGVTSTSGGRSDDVRACLRATPNRKYVLVVRNQDDVPLTIRGRWISDVWSVKPNESIEIHLSDELQLGQWLSFEPNLYAGVATAVTEYLQDKRSSGVKWARCAELVTAQCVAGGLADLLPETVEVGRFRVPVGRVASVLTMLWEYKPMLDTWRQQSSGTSGGRLTILRRT